MANYLQRLDVVEATLGQRTQPNRLITVFVDEGEDEAKAIAAAKRANDIAPDDESIKLIIVQWVSPAASSVPL